MNHSAKKHFEIKQWLLCLLLQLGFLSILLFCPMPISQASMNSVYRVAVETGMPPFQYVNENGDVSGMHIDMMDAIAQIAGLRIEYVLYDRMSGAISDLQDGSVDMVLGALRTDVMNGRELVFTDTVTTSSICMVVDQRVIQSALPANYLYSTAFEYGTISFSRVSQLPVRDRNVMSNQVQLYNALTSGQVDSVIAVRESIQFLLEKNGISDRYEVLRNYLASTDNAILTRASDRALYAQLNEAIGRLRAGTQYEDILNRWIVDRELERANIRFRRVLTGIAIVAVAGAVVMIFFMAMNYRLKKLVDHKTLEIQAQMERMYEASKAQTLNRTIAGIAHEIKNPLTSIRSFASLITEQGSDPEFQEAFRKYVPQEVDRISGMIETLINYARPPRAHKEHVMIDELVSDCVRLASVSAHKSVELTTQTLPDTGILANKNQLQQALTNLLMNAIESAEARLASEKRPDAKAHVCIRAMREKDTEIVLEVEDDGTGMNENQLLQCTEPFFTTKKSGTGMGLALTSQFTKENGGRLEIKSEPGKYTVARMIFNEDPTI